MRRGVNYWIAARLGARFYYGWVITGTVLVSNLAAFSLNPTFGLFVTPLEHEFGWDRATIARSLALGTVFGAALAPLLGAVIDRIGTRRLMVTFGLGGSLCYLALRWVTSVWQYNLIYAITYTLILTGVGQMMSSVNISRWFVRRRGRAMGMVMMGASGGSVFFVPLSNLLIDQMGWRNAYLALAVASLVLITLPAWLLLVDTPEQLELERHDELRGVAAREPAGGEAPEYAPSLGEVACTRAFWLLLAGFMVGMFVVQGYFIHAIPFMESRGFSRLLASTVWSAFFLTGVLAKFSWGFVIERIGVRRALMILFLGEMAGLFVLLAARSPWMLFFYAVLNGIGHGPFLQLQAMVWAEYFGRRAIGRIYGVVQPAIVVMGSLGPWLGGYLYDVSASYDVFFYLLMGLCLVAVGLFHGLPAPPSLAR
jgi:MFS family permease